MTGLLLKNAMLVDGTGAPQRMCDVRISAGKIVEVGPGLSSRHENVIDVDGAIVAPGFIDCHTHFDANIFWDPECDPLLHHGVTSIVIGNCSLGFAPVRPAMRAALGDIFSYLEDIPVEVFHDVVPWEWETFEQYSAYLDKMGLGVNVAAFVGHSQLREYVLGIDAWTRPSTADEREQLVGELARAMGAGALGLSVSYFDRDRKGNKVPSQLADEAELDALLAVVGRYGGSLQFVPSADQPVRDIEYLGERVVMHGVRLLHNALLDREGQPDYKHRILDAFAAVRERGAMAFSMVSPRPFEAAVMIDQSLAFIALPAWNEFTQASADTKRVMLGDESWRARARHDFDTVETSFLFPVHKIDKIRIVTTNGGDHEAWCGRSLGDMARDKGGHPSDALADWILANDLNTSFVVPLANAEPDGVAFLLNQQPTTFIGGSDAGAHLQMFSGVGDTTILLARHVRDRDDLTLEGAVHQLTGRQADILGFADRGRIAPGLVADITVFRLEDLRYENETTVHDVPGGRPRFRREDGNYLYTIVNGEIMLDHGRSTGKRPAGFLALQGRAA